VRVEKRRKKKNSFRRKTYLPHYSKKKRTQGERGASESWQQASGKKKTNKQNKPTVMPIKQTTR